MATKKCNSCGCEKATSEFYKAKGCEFGVAGTCKECQRKKAKDHYHNGGGREVKTAYAISHTAKRQEYSRWWRVENKEKVNEYNSRNWSKYKASNRQWVEHNKKYIAEYQKAYRHRNKDKIKAVKDAYTRKNKAKLAEKRKQWVEKNKEELLKKRRLHDAKLRRNPIYRLHHNVSRRISECLRGGKQGRSWEKLVGYTTSELKAHLESQFSDGMSWDNYGKWHIDHIKPKAVFAITSAECPSFRECWAIHNLQPMWAKLNMAKGKRTPIKECPPVSVARPDP